jgi:hypothetical protein
MDALTYTPAYGFVVVQLYQDLTITTGRAVRIMIHDSTWLARTRVMRRIRLAAPVGFLLACALLAALPGVASATAPEMSGEWELIMSSGSEHVKGIALISSEANAQGEFAASSVRFEGVVPGTFSGTLEGSKASVKLTTQAYGPFPAGEFTSSTMTIESNGGSLSISGKGLLTTGGPPMSRTLIATRIKTHKQIEEQEEKEKQEQEERELRENIRGEWSLTLKVGPQTSHGTALITADANAQNEFASSSALFEGFDPGTFSGTLEGGKASVAVTNQAFEPVPAGEFTSSTMTVVSSSNSLSISGSGTLTLLASKGKLPAELTATRTKTYKEVTERQAKEKAEREKAEHEAKEKAEREAKEKAEREAREAAEKAAAGKPGQQSGGNGSTPPLVSVAPAGKTFTVSPSGVLSLRITNPNPYAIAGRVTLLVAQAGKAGKVSTATGKAKRKKGASLGTASFGISPTGTELVKIKLSKLGRTETMHHAVIHVIATIITQANGQTSTIKTFALTLHAKPARSKA